MFEPSISHDRADEDIIAKARWFASLTAEERMEMLCVFTDMAFAANPDIAERKDAQSRTGRIRVLSLPRR